MLQTNKSKALFDKAKNVIPGGVNSPVRAFKAVGGNPIFMDSAKGAYLYDADGNRYIELINSWGPMILGHAHPEILEAIRQAVGSSLSFGAPTFREIEMAEQIISMVPAIEKVRMVNSGTEACMAAIRLARGYTGKSKIIKFEGCYHGHGDSFLIAAGSGAVTMGVPDSLGVTQGVANDTLTAHFNDLKGVEALLDANLNQVAAIIVEPIVGNMGCVLPQKNFLIGLHSLCNKHSTLLIFDEVMTGFRVAKGGAQEVFDIKPDLTTLGKIIGGGMPVGAYGGKKEIMDYIAPIGGVYQAGTLSGNPIAMAAGLTMLRYLDKHPEVYTQLSQISNQIVEGIRDNMEKLGLNYTLNQFGSMFSLFFTQQPVVDFPSAKTADLQLFAKYFQGMLHKGIYLAPSQFETLFVSTALSQTDVQEVIQANYEVLANIHQ